MEASMVQEDREVEVPTTAGARVEVSMIEGDGAALSRAEDDRTTDAIADGDSIDGSTIAEERDGRAEAEMEESHRMDNATTEILPIVREETSDSMDSAKDFIFFPSYSLRTRLSYWTRSWLARSSLFSCRLYSPAFLLKPSDRSKVAKGRGPTLTKYYSSDSDRRLLARIFIPGPESCRPGPLPLYIDVHGGGFLRGSAAEDDGFCAQLAHRHGICVISVGYRNSPRWLFPTAIYDVVKVVTAILDSDGLPIDRSRVVLGGFSAGASIALAAVQTNELINRVHGVVAFCPITNWAIPSAHKLEGVEQHRGSSDSVADRNHRPDRISAKLWNLLQWAYIPPGTDLHNPLLSPAFAARAALPAHIYLVGAEHDMLCAEAEAMAMELAAAQEEDGLPYRGAEHAWEKGGVRWEKMLGWRHGFTHLSEEEERWLWGWRKGYTLGFGGRRGRGRGRMGGREREMERVREHEREVRRLQEVESLFDRVGRHLWDTAYI